MDDPHNFQEARELAPTGKFKVVFTLEGHGHVGELDDRFTNRFDAGMAAQSQRIPDIGLQTKVVEITEEATENSADTDDEEFSSTLWTDGASRGNPGHAGAGIVLNYNPNREPATRSAYLGDDLTNNKAEYSALEIGCRMINRQEIQEVTICCDSELVVKQLQGEYSVNSEKLASHKREIESLLSGVDWEIIHVPREENEEADELANAAIDGEQPET